MSPIPLFSLFPSLLVTNRNPGLAGHQPHSGLRRVVFLHLVFCRLLASKLTPVCFSIWIYTWFISPSFSQPQAVRRSLQQDLSSPFFSLRYRLTSTSKQSIHLYSVFFSALCQTRQRSNDSASLVFLPSSLTHAGYALQNSSFTASPTFGRDTSSRKSISRTTY